LPPDQGGFPVDQVHPMHQENRRRGNFSRGNEVIE